MISVNKPMYYNIMMIGQSHGHEQAIYLSNHKLLFGNLIYTPVIVDALFSDSSKSPSKNAKLGANFKILHLRC